MRDRFNKRIWVAGLLGGSAIVYGAVLLHQKYAHKPLPKEILVPVTASYPEKNPNLSAPKTILAHSVEQKAIVETSPKSTRGLTDGEAQLIKSILGEAIDLSKVEFAFYDQTLGNTATDVLEGDTRRIYVFGEKFASKDYSKEKDHFLFSLLAYEATRLWQQQMEKVWKKGDHPGNEYVLHSSLAFSNYSPYQQAAIVQDYAGRMLHSAHLSQWMDAQYGANNCDADNFLIRLVETQFPQAKYARESLNTSRSPTTEEASLVRTFFGAQINPEKVRYYSSPRKCFNNNGGYTVASVGSPSAINFYGTEFISDDYSKAKDVYNFGIAMHEWTHIWQQQTQWKYTNHRFVNKPDVYSFPIDVTKWTFKDYGLEQQGAIVEDYVRHFLRPEQQAIRTGSDQLSQLAVLVENQFPGARKLRQYYEIHTRLPQSEIPAQDVASKKMATVARAPS